MKQEEQTIEEFMVTSVIEIIQRSLSNNDLELALQAIQVLNILK